MHFLIIHGEEGNDRSATEHIFDQLRKKGQTAEILTDEEFLKEKRRSNGYFIISVGGKLVNSVSGRIQDIYSRALDVSGFDMMDSFCYCWGSRDGIKSNSYNLNSGCLALWGPETEDTLNTVKDFIRNGALLDDIIKNYKTWTKTQ